MDYNFEVLGDERFQKLCQAILVATFPNLQCLPVGQPDGGRDAIQRHETGFVAFQVKYSRDPNVRTERDSIAALIKTERPKVLNLIKRGATAYYLLTNVAGTSHLEKGSIDIINETLTEAFGVPSFCWWRDDLERRIEVIPGLIWRYPEIARGSDFLEVMAEIKGSLFTANQTAIFRAYVATQYSKESEVRFQQVQIQNSLFDLFTDTPLGESREKQPSLMASGIAEEVFRLVAGSYDRARYGYSEHARGSVLAAEWLMSAAPKAGVQRIVLEGAPGQGKSTVTQYMCQLHRLKALRNEQDSDRVPVAYTRYGVRLPLRVDLRDYASWLLGKDPFAVDRDAKRPDSGLDALESFLAYQIHTLSGAQPFSSEDVTAVLKEAHVLLVLDGFDEVADIPLRARLIEQIRGAAARLGSWTASTQLIVTSRPAAFILSPGFPEREWSHYRLLPLEPAQISEYSDKWMAAKSLSPQDRRDFKELVIERTARPHIKILAQNPMQLAILLWLISTKGRSLPDKRTALYDSYMDLFFGREAEKDATVRDNRDIIVQIHEYIAWKLQTDAESEGSSGAIAEEDLKTLVYSFLVEKEHPTSEVLRLFSGVVERVGALVSRVQGTVEFEVQPLREYFAGKYLYLTAPYSPPGSEKGGTKPDRFDGLARRPYWSNVTRFYAGCYSSGELSSLVDGIETIHEEAEFKLTSHALQLAVWFLNDWVFTQEPRTVRAVIRFLTAGRNLRLLLSSRASWEDSRLTFPDKCGRADFAAELLKIFLQDQRPDYLWRLGLALRANTSFEERWQIWRADTSASELTFRRAVALGLFSDAGPDEVKQLVKRYGSRALRELVVAERWETFQRRDIAKLFYYTLDSSDRFNASIYGLRRHSVSTGLSQLYLAYMLLNPSSYAVMHYDRYSDVSLIGAFSRYGRLIDLTIQEPSDHVIELGYHDYVQTVTRVSQLPVRSWISEIEPWSDFIESARRTWGDRPRLLVLAAVAAGIKSTSERASAFSNILDPSLPLAERARYARLRSSASWWRDMLNQAQSVGQVNWVLLLLLSWAPSSSVLPLLDEITMKIDALTDAEWEMLFNSVQSVINATSESRTSLTRVSFDDLKQVTSFRVIACLFLRLSRQVSKQVWQTKLINYTGDDEGIVLQTVRYGIYESVREQKWWQPLISFMLSHPITAAKADLDTSSIGRIYFDSRNPLPDWAAISIMENLSAMPVSLLDAAELRLTRRAASQPPPLKLVAEAEQWFS